MKEGNRKLEGILIIAMAIGAIVFIAADIVARIQDLRNSENPRKELRKSIFRVGAKLLALAAAGGIIGALLELQKTGGLIP